VHQVGNYYIIESFLSVLNMLRGMVEKRLACQQRSMVHDLKI